MTKARDVADLLANGTVDTDELADGLITTAKLADNSVTTAKIQDGAITAPKLNVQGSDIPYDNTTSGISANTLQEAIDYLNVLSGGGSAGAQATYTRENFTATAGQTTFTTTNGYELGYLQVYMNGVLLATSDFTANDGSTVVLAVGASAGDEISTIALDSFAISELLRIFSISASAPDDSLSFNAEGQLVLQNGDAGSSNGTRYDIGKSSVGNIHIIGTYGTSPTNTNQHGITYQNNNANNTQAAIIITDNGSDGTSVGLFSTESYATGPQLGLSVEPNGFVTTPRQPAFTVGLNGNVSSHQDGVTVTTWTTAKNGCFNRGGYMGSTYFTVPVQGVYHFDVSLLFNPGSTAGWAGAYILVNGVVKVDALGGSFPTAYDYQLVNRSINMFLQQGDLISVQIRDSGGDGFIYDGNIYSWFSGHLVG